MAIPTITAINPNIGAPLGGFLISITGTNFRLPDLLPGTSVAQESVRVFFNGRVAPHVYVFSDTLLEVIVPEDLSDPALVSYPLIVSVEIQNIDASGVVIPGEIVIDLAGFTYTKPELIGGVAEAIFRYVIRHIRRNVAVQAVGIVHADYQSNGLVTLPESVSLPCVMLTSQRPQPSAIATETFQNIDSDRIPGLAKGFNYFYDMVILSNKTQELQNLLTQIEKVIRKSNDFLLLWMGEDWPVFMRWETVPAASTVGNYEGSVQQATGTFVVENVPGDDDLTYIAREIDTLNFSIGDMP